MQETVCSSPGAGYQFRYDGLELVVRAGGQYLLLPTGWTRTDGRALVLPASDEVRLEYSAPVRADGAAGC